MLSHLLRKTLLNTCVLAALLGQIFLLRLDAQTQAFTATLNGFVSDASGSRIPGAEVTLTSTEQGITRHFTSDSQGGYSFALLPPATYTLTVKAQGFQAYNHTNIVLAAGQAATVNASLAVGATTQQVNVSAQAPLLNTADANLSATVSGSQVRALPLDMRNVFSLAGLNSSVHMNLLGPGLSLNADQDVSFLTFGGSFFSTTPYLLDGTWDTAADWGGVIFVPSVDAVQEFKIQTNAFTAQYGWSAGNVINVVTKSGTSSFHGDAYEFLRNDVLDANNFFNNAAGIERPAFRRNQFGVSAGGPLYIPGIYKQRNKTFIFGLYEGVRQSNPLTLVTTMPTSAMRAGDFSALLGPQVGTDALGRPILGGQIFDAFSTRQIAAGQADPVTGLVATRTGYIRDPFAGNKIPSGLLNPIAANFLQYWPDPKSAALINNFTATAATPAFSDEVDLRVDHNFTDMTRIFGRWSYKRQHKVTEPAYYGADNPASPKASNPDNRWNLVAGLTHIFGPTAVMSVNAGLVHWREENHGAPSYPFAPSSLGLPAQLDSVSNEFPLVSITGIAGLGGQSEAAYPRANGSYSVDFSKILGQHSLSMGFMGVVLRTSTDQLIRTELDFSNAFTQGPDPNAPLVGTGAGFASFLLGVGDGSTGIAANSFTSKSYYAAYIQDDWKATRRLTLNLGLRYQYQTAPRDRWNHASYFDFQAVNPISSAIGFNVPGTVVFATPGHPGVYSPQVLNWAPRVGVAYQAASRLVLRAGFGIFYLPSYSGAPSTQGFSQSTPWVGSLDGLTPLNTLSNPFPDGLVQPTGSAAGALTDVGLGVGAVNNYRPSPYMEDWMFGTEFSITHNDLLSVSYVGNHGLKIPASVARNQLSPQYLSLGNQLLDEANNPFYGHIASSGCGLDQPAVPLGQLLRPYPEFCGVGEGSAPVGASYYEALQVHYTHRFHSGLNVLVSYTWSKFLDDTTGPESWIYDNAAEIRNNYNLMLDKALDVNDLPQSLVVSYVYQLPIGRGKAFGTNLPTALNAIIGGWQLSGIATLQSGPPLSILAENNNTHSLGGSQRPDIVGDPILANPTISEWFSTSAFAQPAPFTWGNAPRTMAHAKAPGLANWDLAIEKWWNFTETAKLEFRAEMFNALNHTNFAPPNQTFGDPSFGTITTAAPARDIQLALKLYW